MAATAPGQCFTRARELAGDGAPRGPDIRRDVAAGCCRFPTIAREPTFGSSLSRVRARGRASPAAAVKLGTAWHFHNAVYRLSPEHAHGNDDQ